MSAMGPSRHLATMRVLLRVALHPLHREFTSEVDAVGRPHKGTLARAGYAVGACVSMVIHLT
jgi:hypothetical protein